MSFSAAAECVARLGISPCDASVNEPADVFSRDSGVPLEVFSVRRLLTGPASSRFLGFATLTSEHGKVLLAL